MGPMAELGSESSRASPPDLIAYIQKTYHEPLRVELPKLEEMSAKVARVHAERDGKRLRALAHAIKELRMELISHLDKEDHILFPMILAGNGPMVQMPIARMQHDHGDHAAALNYIRQLTDDYTVPTSACATWRRLWQSLAELDHSLHEHINLENNILFPKAIELG